MPKNEPLMTQPPRLDMSGPVLDSEMRRGMMYEPGSIPQVFDEAWMKYIIEFHYSFEMPEQQAHEIISMMKPLIDLGPKSNIRRREITMYLYGFDLVWENYLMYVKKGKYDGNLLTLRELLRNAYELQLNRSVDGWLGRLMHTKLFRIFTTDSNQGTAQRTFRFLGKKNKNTGNNQEGM